MPNISIALLLDGESSERFAANFLDSYSVLSYSVVLRGTETLLVTFLRRLLELALCRLIYIPVYAIVFRFLTDTFLFV
jgi:hypothetical protein